MKKLSVLLTVLLVAVILLDLFVVGLFAYETATSGSVNPSSLLRAILLLGASVFTVIRLFAGSSSKAPSRTKIAYYRERYKPVVAHAFLRDRRGEKAFFTAVEHYVNNNYAAAVKGFSKLLKKAKSNEDLFALYSFLGFSYEDMKLYDRAAELYRRAVLLRDSYQISARITHCERMQYEKH